MLVDDSVQDKRYSRFIELVKLQYSGAEHGPVRGIGIVNLVHGAGVRKDFYPMDYRFLLIHSWNLSRFPPKWRNSALPSRGMRTGSVYRMMILGQIVLKERNMSIFSDIFKKILDKVKGVVPGANTLSDVNLTVELDKLAKGRGLNWKVSVVDFLKLIGANSSRENRDALATELGVDASLESGSAQKNETLRKALFKKIAENGGKIPASLLD
ncbi:MAG TPA: DUF3597 family protein [Anaerolineales bacterium]|nr:DUF3597 family protein [Anaerolineales bacterium]